MAGETTSSNMGMPIPGVSVTSGPTWATDLNNCLNIIDQHTHTSGSGVPITPDAISMTTDLPFLSNSATGLKSTQYTAQSSLADLRAVYVISKDLYYNDADGNAVRITQSGGVAGSPGSISNLVSPASAAYSAAASKFIWQSDSNIAADMDFGAAIMRNITPNSTFALTLQPPAALSSNYSISLPSLPISQKFMTLDASGNMSAPWSVDGSTITVSSSTIKVPDGGIGTTQIADQAVTAGKVANGTLTSVQMTASTYGKSASSGNYVTSSTSFVNPTNLTQNITTVISRPVYLTCVPADGTGQNSIKVGTSSGADTLVWEITRDGVSIASGALSSNGAAITYFPLSAITAIDDTQTAAAHDYSVAIKLLTGVTNAAVISGAKFVAWQPNA